NEVGCRISRCRPSRVRAEGWRKPSYRRAPLLATSSPRLLFSASRFELPEVAVRADLPRSTSVRWQRTAALVVVEARCQRPVVLVAVSPFVELPKRLPLAAVGSAPGVPRIPPP